MTWPYHFIYFQCVFVFSCNRVKSFSQKGALRALDLALQKNKRGCELFIDFLGLKTLFRILMKGPCKNAVVKSKADTRDFYGLYLNLLFLSLHFIHLFFECVVYVCLIEGALSCIISLFMQLDEGERRSRLLGKFGEADNEKIARIVELHCQFVQQYTKAQKLFEKISLTDPEQRLTQQIEAGLSVVQTSAVVIALVCSASAEYRRRAFVELAKQRVDPSDIEKHSMNYVEQLIADTDPQHAAMLTFISEARLSSPI